MLKKNILHVYSSYTAGGAEKTTLELVVELEKWGMRNIIAAPKNSWLYNKALEAKLPARPLKINGSFDPVGIIGLLLIVRSEKIDIIHAHQGKVFWPCVFMKWFFKPSLKLVFHRHADLPHRFYSRGHYTAADSVIAISKAVAAGLINKEGVSPEKVKIIYNGVDLRRFNSAVDGSAIRKEYGFEKNIVVGTIAAMNRPKGKGQQYLIEAAAQLRNKLPQLRYMIVGDGEIRQELETMSKNLGVSDIVVFTGFRDQIEKYIAAMDVFCLLSWDTEGLGRVMIEAQAIGKPVIGTNIGGIPETFVNHKTGIMIPPENTAELADAIEFLAERPDARRSFGAEGAKFVKVYFSDEAMTENIILLYSSLFEPKWEA